MRIEPIVQWPVRGASCNPSQPSACAWRVSLDIDSAELDRAYGLLATDELARAARFSFAVHRRRFVAARAALREILGRQFAVNPRGVMFRYTAEGKPELDGQPDWHFSVSHSADLCLIAIGCGLRLGIDVEATVANSVQVDEVARSFHPAERHALALLDQARKEAAFYRCWVRKEALLKGLGVGLGGGLDRFSVSVDDEPNLSWSDTALAIASDWTLIDLGAAGYAAALALETAQRP
jgi:4'-phosphopantetheinyl transferase